MSRLLILLTTLMVTGPVMAADETPQQTAERLARLIDSAETIPSETSTRPAPAEPASERSVEAPATPTTGIREPARQSANTRTPDVRLNGSQSILKRHRTTPLPRVFVEERSALPAERPEARPVSTQQPRRASASDECREPEAPHR